MWLQLVKENLIKHKLTSQRPFLTDIKEGPMILETLFNNFDQYHILHGWNDTFLETALILD